MIRPAGKSVASLKSHIFSLVKPTKLAVKRSKSFLESLSAMAKVIRAISMTKRFNLSYESVELTALHGL